MLLCLLIVTRIYGPIITAVSYTHLDVYKRQPWNRTKCGGRFRLSELLQNPCLLYTSIVGAGRSSLAGVFNSHQALGEAVGFLFTKNVGAGEVRIQRAEEAEPCFQRRFVRSEVGTVQRLSLIHICMAWPRLRPSR